MSSTVRQNLLDLHNNRRRQLGLVALQLDSVLNQGADRYADIMASQNWFSHTRPSGKTWDQWFDDYYPEDYDYPLRSIGENLARGQATTGEVFDDWMASSLHRDNIQKPAFRRMGVGLRYSANGTPYWVAHYSSKP